MANRAGDLLISVKVRRGWADERPAFPRPNAVELFPVATKLGAAGFSELAEDIQFLIDGRTLFEVKLRRIVRSHDALHHLLGGFDRSLRCKQTQLPHGRVERDDLRWIDLGSLQGINECSGDQINE